MPVLVDALVVLVLTLANGVFAGAEIAVISVRNTRLEELGSRGGAGAALVRLRRDPERFLATVQIGITVVSATAAAVGGATLAEPLAAVLAPLGLDPETGENIAFGVVVASVSFLSLVLGELVPKSLALKWAEPYALLVARPLWLLSRVSAPLVWLLTASSNLLLRAFGDRTSFSESQISRDELLTVIDQATDAGEVSPRAGDMAVRALELEALHVGSVMVPRSAILAIDATATPIELATMLDAIDEERLPVQRAGDDIIGYVTMRDVARMVAGRTNGGGLAAILRPVHFVPESALALEVLEQLQSRRVPIAVVVDEEGGVEGVVDIDDLAEEVVGSLLVGSSRDEAEGVDDGEGVVLAASVRVHVVNRRFDLDLPTSARWSTLGGLVLARLGTVPSVGARVMLDDGSVLEVMDASARRVHRVRVRPAPARAAE